MGRDEPHPPNASSQNFNRAVSASAYHAQFCFGHTPALLERARDAALHSTHYSALISVCIRLRLPTKGG